METDQAAGQAAAGQAAAEAEAEATPFAKRLALFKVRWQSLQQSRVDPFSRAGIVPSASSWLPGHLTRIICVLLPPRLQTILNSVPSFVSASSTPPALSALPLRLQTILNGDVPIELERQFLARHNAADLQILKNIRATVEPRNR